MRPPRLAILGKCADSNAGQAGWSPPKHQEQTVPAVTAVTSLRRRPVTIDDPVTLARELLMSDEVVLGKDQAPHTTATAQAWATLAVAEAVKRLAVAVEALHESG